MNYPSPYCTPQHPGSREGANTPQFANFNNDLSNYQQQQNVGPKTQSPHHSFAHMSSSMSRNSPLHHPSTKTPPVVTSQQKEINCNDVATKSLSGLESLVDQIPTDADRLGGPVEYVKSETLTDSVLNQYQPPVSATSDYNSQYTNSGSSGFSSPYGASNHYSALSTGTSTTGTYNMSSPFSVNNILTSNSYGAPPGAINNYHSASKPPPTVPPPHPHHISPANAHLFMPEPPHMPVPMFPYTQQNPYPTYPAATPHPSLLQPSYPYSPYSNPGYSSHHMFDRF